MPKTLKLTQISANFQLVLPVFPISPQGSRPGAGSGLEPPFTSMSKEGLGFVHIVGTKRSPSTAPDSEEEEPHESEEDLFACLYHLE